MERLILLYSFITILHVSLARHSRGNPYHIVARRLPLPQLPPDISLDIIQDDLFSIMLRFRLYKYVFSIECTKMHRCILVDPAQCSLQRIIWGFDPSGALQTYKL